MSERYSGLPSERFKGVEDARKQYLIGTRDGLFISGLETQLCVQGVAKIAMPISENDFKSLLDSYEQCIEEAPDELAKTFHTVDTRFGNDAGHVRKERKFDARSKLQLQDPKNLFHFNESARNRWSEQFDNGPLVLKRFLTDGYEIHNQLIAIAKLQFEELEETHPGITRAHFPGQPGTQHASCSYMRLISYDGYQAGEQTGHVAKPHFDIAGAAIQAYADASGFWGSKDGRFGEKVFYDTGIDEAYFFLGRGYDKLFGESARLKALFHGVDRIIPDDVTNIPKRHAIVLFVNAPFINYGVTQKDTLPYLHEVATNVVSLQLPFETDKAQKH